MASLGFAVSDSLGNKYWTTAAHLPNGFHGANGVTGDTIFSGLSLTAPVPIGIVSYNPNWDAFGCPTGNTYCPLSDVALIRSLNGVVVDFKVGTSYTEGLDGNPGSNKVNNRYAVQGPVTPEWVDTTSYGIHKSGFKTGTTTGQIDLPRTFARLGYGWGPTHATTVYAYYDGLTRVAHMGWGLGDSGGPVFAGNGISAGGYPYYALGLVVGGGGTIDLNDVCNAGSSCAVYFTRWEDMEVQLQKNRLNPATNQTSSSPSTFSVSLAGPTDIQVGCYAEWVGSSSGGTAPYTYSFSMNNVLYDGGGTDTFSLTPAETGSVVINVVVTDANGNTAYGTKTATSTSGACQ